jgi:hypothetical protein
MAALIHINFASKRGFDFIGFASGLRRSFVSWCSEIGSLTDRRLMMQTQLYASQAGTLVMHWGEPVRIDRLAGEFAVVSGRVWLTRRGDVDDHVIEAGQRLVLEPSDEVVIEPWQAGERTLVQWRPRAQPRRVEALPRDAAVFALGGVARLAGAAAEALRFVERGFEDLARKAAAMAKRAQGCICPGDSMASAGTVQ